MKHLQCVVVGLLSLLACSSLIAQEAELSKSDVEYFLKTLAETIEDIETPASIHQLMAFYHPKFTGERLTFKLDGSEYDIPTNAEVINSYGAVVSPGSGLRIRYTIDKINFLQAFGYQAVANLNLTSQRFDGNDLLEESKQNMTLHLIKSGNQVQIRHSYTASVNTIANKSVCLFTYFQDQSGESVIKVGTPAGELYQTNYLYLDFKTVDDNTTVVQTNTGDSFEWAGSELRLINSSKTWGPKMAKNRYDVVLFILESEFNDVCTTFRQKK